MAEQLCHFGPRRRVSGAPRLPVAQQLTANRAQDRLPPVALPGGLDQPLQALIASAEEDVLLTLEVAKEGPRGDVGLSGYPGDGYALEPLSG